MATTGVSSSGETNLSNTSFRNTIFGNTRPYLAKLRDCYILTKPEVNLLILITTSAGYYLGSRGTFHFAGLFHTLLGTLLVASGTATLNQFMERTYDSQMRRTANRPVASGRFSPREAFYFGLLMSVAGGAYLLITMNRMTALLAVSTLLTYLLVYTPLKRKTPLCTTLGAIPGAMPILIGWVGASARLNWQAGILFLLLFFWQFPHFLAIALMYREDYAQAGYKMLPAFDREGHFTRVEIIALTIALLIVTILPLSGHSFSLPYFSGMILAGLFFLYHSVRLAVSASSVAASRLLHASVIYLPIVLGMMMAAKA